MTETNHKITIIATMITVTGTIIAAVISNWDKFSYPGQQSRTTIVSSVSANHDSPTNSASRATNTTNVVSKKLDISGNWRDVNFPNNGSNIIQNGNTYTFTGWGSLPQGLRFRSTGNGNINGKKVSSTYIVNYQNGMTSSGQCSGTVSGSGNEMTSTCQDTLLGMFVTSGVRY